MIKLQVYPGTSKTLINQDGQLADCVCCCPNLPETLYLHVDPVFGDPNCEALDVGVTYGMSHSAALAACDDWVVDDLSLTGFCYTGEGGASFGMNAILSCYPTNRFRLEICFFSTGSAPDQMDAEGCHWYQSSVTADTEFTCEAPPGDFSLDFGEVTFESSPGAWDYCTCDFHIYIDEIDEILPTAITPYFYPAEGSYGVFTHSLGTLWHFETVPSIGTPLHPEIPLAIRYVPPPEIDEAFTL